MRFREQMLRELESRKKVRTIINPNDIIIQQRNIVTSNWKKLRQNVAKLHFTTDFLNNKCRELDAQIQGHLKKIQSMRNCVQYMKNLFGIEISEKTLKLQQILRENEEEANRQSEENNTELESKTMERIMKQMESEYYK